MAETRVSIIIPVYNVALYLEICVRLCLCQTWEDIEVICVDDGSTDASGAMLDALAAEDPRLIVIHQPNGGVVAAREAGLAAATSPWILFCDADDLLAADAVERLVLRQQETGARLVVCDYMFFYGAALPARPMIPYDFDQLSRDDAIRALLTVTIGWIHGKLIDRALLARLTVPRGITIGEDFLMMIQMVTYAGGMVRDHTPLYFYRQRIDSVVHRASLKNFRSLDLAYAEIRAFLTRENLLDRFTNEMTIAEFHLLGNYLSTAKWIGHYRSKADIRDHIRAANRLPPPFNRLAWKTLQKNQGWTIALAWFAPRLAAELNARFAPRLPGMTFRARLLRRFKRLIGAQPEEMKKLP